MNNSHLNDQKNAIPGKRKRFLKIAGTILIIIGIIVVVYPFWPEFEYQLFPPKENDYPYPTKLNNTATNDVFKIPEENRIVITKIGVDMEIIEGVNEDVALNLGAWHMPDTPAPDEDGNTVITAHRFKYRPPSKKTFYLLDKLEIDDKIIIYWEGVEYDYQVREIKIVEPNALEILNNTDNVQLTLFTCTPLFSTKQRLVVISESMQI